MAYFHDSCPSIDQWHIGYRRDLLSMLVVLIASMLVASGQSRGILPSGKIAGYLQAYLLSYCGRFKMGISMQ